VGAALGAIDSEDDDGLKGWTVAMYWDADNDLDGLTATFVDMWITHLTNTEDVAMAVYIDGLNTPANISTYTEEGWVEREALGEMNTSDPATLQHYIEFVLTEPSIAAENYCLIVQDHGLDYLGLCVDESEPSRPFMSVDGFASAVAGATAATGGWLDIIELDACTMAIVEMAYELRDKAGYLVASEKAVPFDGLNYIELMDGLSADPDISPLDLAIKMVDDYAEWYSAPLGTYPTLYPYMQDFACLSVMDLSRMKPLADAFSEFKEQVLPRDPAVKSSLNRAANNAFLALWMNCMACDYGRDIRVMFSEFADGVRATRPEAAAAADAIVDAVDDIVVYDWASWRFRDICTGMSVFVPPGEGLYYVYWDSLGRVYDQLGLDFVTDTGWDEVLHAYFLSQK